MKDSRINVVFTLLLLTIVVDAAKNLPKYFPNCHRYDPNINQCLLKATEAVKPYITKGVSELNFPRIEPFHLPEVSLEQGTSALNFKAVLKDIIIEGLSNYKFSQFDFDVPNLQFFCKATISPLKLSGKYTVVGRILVAPIEGAGKFTAAIDSVNVTIYQAIKEIKKKGVTFVTPTNTTTTIKVSGPKAHLEGLFNDNEELNNVTNKVIEDNVDVLFEDLKPVIEKVITSIVEDLLLASLEDNVPFDKLYPPIP